MTDVKGARLCFPVVPPPELAPPLPGTRIVTPPESEPAPDSSPLPPERGDFSTQRKFILGRDLSPDNAGPRIDPLASLTPEARAELAFRADPANWSEAARRRHALWERVVARRAPAYGGAVDALPPAAVAAAVRDPGASISRLVVGRPDASDDGPLDLGYGVLFDDEMDQATPGARRLLFVLPDRRVRIETESRVEWTPLLGQLVTVLRDRVQALQALAAQVAPIAVPGVGAVRIVPRFDDVADSADGELPEL